MLVKDVMSEPVITTTTATSLVEAARIMLELRISGLPVVDAHNRVVGTLSEADLLQRVELGSETHHSWISSLFVSNRTLAREYVREGGITVGEVMSPSAITILADEPLSKAVSLMGAYNTTRLFVQRDKSIVGVLARSDVVRALLKKLVENGASKSDAELQILVMSEFHLHPFCKDYALKVVVSDGSATISGAVFDEGHRKAIVVTAERIPGIRSVVNSMTWVDPYSGFSEPVGGTEG